MKVGNGMASCTTRPCPVVIPDFPTLIGNRLVLVDTPGLDNGNKGSDGQILTQIAECLADW